MMKKSKIFALTLVMSLLVLATLGANVEAQAQATVEVLDSVGGTTTPAGTTTYDDGTSVTFEATPDTAYIFVNWIFSTPEGSNTATDNPITFPVSGGTTYTVQAIFQPIEPVPGKPLPVDMSTAAIVVVLSSAGGTTSPVPGTYALANADSLNLQAIPESGWKFSNWVISGPGLSHGGYPFTATPIDNPYNVNHGYGNMFSYQAVFKPIEAIEPSPTIPEFSSIATIIIALAMAAGAVGTITYRRKFK